MAVHLDCSRTYIGKLEAESVIQRQGDDFPLNGGRPQFLFSKHRQMPRRRLRASSVRMTKTDARGGFEELAENYRREAQVCRRTAGSAAALKKRSGYGFPLNGSG
jgi:hypothetical protein